MAKTDIFHDTTSTIPKSDARIARIDFDKEDLGARKSHTSGIHRKNSYAIQHIKGA